MLNKYNFTKNFLLPVNDLITGNTINKKFDFLQKSQWWSRAEIEKYQNDRLRKLIRHSVLTVPYYKELFRKNNLKIKDINNKNDLKKIPILDKEIIKNEGLDKFISVKYPKSKMIKSSSSGSTGEPLFYYDSKDAYSMNIAANLRGWYWMGYKFGDKYVKLAHGRRNSYLKNIQDRLSNNFYLNTIPLKEYNFEYILSKIEYFKPKIIRSYPDPLLFLARYKKKNLKFTYEPEAINTTGNILFPEVRDEIESIFNCKIFDSYCCEANSNVFECNTHSSYHSSEEYGISEILSSHGNNRGLLISTDLYNFAQPFIRYNTQDEVEIDDSACECRRNLLKIKKIWGRDNDTIITPSGEKLIVHSFTGWFQTDHKELNKSVKQFQIIKTKNNLIKFNLVVNENYNNNVSKFILDYWTKIMKYSIEINIVDKIKLTSSGKRRFIINE